MRKATAGVATALLAFGLSPNPVLAHGNEAVGRSVCNGDTNTCDPATSVSRADAKFLRTVAEGDSFEIAAGKLAQAKATDSDTAQLGATLASDDTTALGVLQTLAAKYGVDLPTAPSDDQAGTLADLGTIAGLHFDDEFAELAVSGNQAAVALFGDVAKDAFNNDVRAFAAASLPLLNAHLTAAQALNAAIEALPGHEGDAAPEGDEGAVTATAEASVTATATVTPSAAVTPTATDEANDGDEAAEANDEDDAHDARDEGPRHEHQGDHHDDHHKEQARREGSGEGDD